MNKKILLTGTTGFIGKHLRDDLKVMGYDVYSLERYVTGRIGKTLPYEKNTYFTDLTDVYSMNKAMQDIKPEIVIHLGAMTAVAYSYAHYWETLNINFMGTANLAEICTKIPEVEQFIYASSAEVYGVSPNLLKKETDTNLSPNSPYSVSKYASEQYLMYLHKAYGFPVTIFRPFNSYGRKEDRWFVVERIITQMLSGDKCYLGDPEPIRDFLYLYDQLNAYVHAIDNPKAIGEIFNISSGVGISIKDLADKIKNLIGWDGEIIWQSLPKRALDIHTLIGDNLKIKDVLGVPEPYSLDDGLELTIDYWKEKLNVKDR